MKLFTPIAPAVIVAIILALPSTQACWFGTISCRDGQPAGEGLAAVTSDTLNFAIDLGEQEINGVLNNAKECYKLLAGKETTCNELNGVKGCLNTALDLWPATRAAKAAKIAAEKLDLADNAIDIMTTKVIPALDTQCIAGCLGGKPCMSTKYVAPSPTVAPTPTSTEDCVMPSNTTAPATAPAPAEPVTLIYSPPTGCACKNITITIEVIDSTGQTIDMCARNLAFNMDGTSLSGKQVQLRKANYSEKGCFVGKTPDDQASYASCTKAFAPTQDTISLSGETAWDVSGLYN